MEDGRGRVGSGFITGFSQSTGKAVLATVIDLTQQYLFPSNITVVRGARDGLR